MSFYGGLANTATNLLTKYGQTVTFSRETGGAFDPTLGEESGATTTTWTGNGAAFNFNRSEIDGVMVQASDLRLLLEAVSTAPAIGDQVTVDSVAYHVISVTPASPGGVVVKYDLQIRL